MPRQKSKATRAKNFIADHEKQGRVFSIENKKLKIKPAIRKKVDKEELADIEKEVTKLISDRLKDQKKIEDIKQQVNPGGRPTDYTPEIAEIFCSYLAEGLSVRTICRFEEMPSKRTFFRWLNKHPEFRTQYEVAKEQSVPALYEDMMDDLMDDVGEPLVVNGKPIKDANGDQVMVITAASISYARLKYDARKWALSKLAPKKFGDKLALGKTDDFGEYSDDELAAIISSA